MQPVWRLDLALANCKRHMVSAMQLACREGCGEALRGGGGGGGGDV